METLVHIFVHVVYISSQYCHLSKSKFRKCTIQMLYTEDFKCTVATAASGSTSEGVTAVCDRKTVKLAGPVRPVGKGVTKYVDSPGT